MRKRLVALLAVVLVAGCRNPRLDANIVEAIIQLETNMDGVQQDYGMLQDQLDSLRRVVARQDSTIRQLAVLANVQVPR